MRLLHGRMLTAILLAMVYSQYAHGNDVLGTPAAIGDPDPERVKYWESVLSDKPRGVGPTITDRAAWGEIAQRPGFSELLVKARMFAKEPMPELTDDLFLSYSRTGNRRPAERRIHERADYFATLVYAECIENRGEFLPAIERALASYAAQKTWLYPAHDPRLDNFRGETVEVSICASALGWNVATAVYWLGDKLRPETRQLIADNLERRFFTPVEHLVKTGKPRPRWLLMTNNHNPVTLSGVIGAAFAQLESKSRRAYFAAVAEKFIENYFVGFTADGYCSEGVGYWNYGFGRYLLLAETLRQATDGKVDWLEQPRVQKIAEFGRRIEILDGRYPSFADCSPLARPSTLMLGLLSQRYQWGLEREEIEGLELARNRHGFLFDFGMYAMLPAKEGEPTSEEPALPLRDYFDVGGVLICRPEPGRGSFAVALKGGHNQEHHNHNDLGSFMVSYQKTNLLVDPGAEIYSSRTFSTKRYESGVLSSFGHSVPRVAGKLQSTGRQAKAKITETKFTDTVDQISMDLSAAYDVLGLTELERTFVYDRTGDGQLTVLDRFHAEEPIAFETALVTFSAWKQEQPNRLRIGEGLAAVIIEIAAAGSEFRVQPVAIHEQLPGEQIPIRLAIELVDPIAKGNITVTIRPATFSDESR